MAVERVGGDRKERVGEQTCRAQRDRQQPCRAPIAARLFARALAAHGDEATAPTSGIRSCTGLGERIPRLQQRERVGGGAVVIAMGPELEVKLAELIARVTGLADATDFLTGPNPVAF